ncbi:MAG: signal recognition particle receptor subunit alpha, partial [Bacilli bacterium]|nr:signal recognition particle receptor subunit alpha [Bacilli bacterium]
MGLFSFLKEKFSHKDKTSDSILTYDKGLKKAKKAFTDKINDISKDDSIPSNYFDKLEEILIEADVGISLTTEIINNLANTIRENKIKTLHEANEALVGEMFKD